jgi:hypothetical protein
MEEPCLHHILSVGFFSFGLVVEVLYLNSPLPNPIRAFFDIGAKALKGMTYRTTKGIYRNWKVYLTNALRSRRNGGS